MNFASTQTSASSINEREFIKAKQQEQNSKSMVKHTAPPATSDIINDLDDRRITSIKPLLPPSILIDELPLTQTAFETIDQARREIEHIIQGRDDRLLVVVGPCSIHDTRAALDYARRLKAYADEAQSDLKIVMRVYFEKPRTTVGWKGLINDPDLDGSFKINKGLRIARELLLAINDLGVPCGCEFLDTISPQFIGDLVSWGAIGARTTESQIHRELASGLSVPVGFKNGTDGSVQIAIDAIKAARESHHFLSVTKQGLSAIVCTAGNPACHVILRGAVKGPNYSKKDVADVAVTLKKASLNSRLMIDCSHGNSEKQHRRQRDVAECLAQQMEGAADTDSTAQHICGVMIESHLVEGRQNISDSTGPNGQGLVYGKSITDACLGWEDTVQVLDRLRVAVQARRESFGESVVDSF
jgi:3-deoxy-7-phosphoheptulonate synthase